MRYSGDGKFSTILRRVAIAWLVLVCCSVLTAGLFYVYYPGYRKLQETNRKVEAVRANVARIERENKELGERIRILSAPADSPFYLEEVARRNIGLVKDGETVYHLQPPDQR